MLISLDNKNYTKIQYFYSFCHLYCRQINLCRWSKPNKITCLHFISLFVLFVSFFLTPNPSFAQDTIRYDYTGNFYYVDTIPDGTDQITFILKGGDGGTAHYASICCTDIGYGGGGATVTVTYDVVPQEFALPVDSFSWRGRIFMMPGEAGTNNIGSFVEIGGGGGSSGVAYSPHTTSPLYDPFYRWTLIARSGCRCWWCCYTRE
jgi:hypothetical protein